MSAESILGWWFCQPDADGVIRLPHGDGRVVKAGETLTLDGEIVAYERGLHASVQAIDALKYATGATVCRVRLSGRMDRKSDKIAASRRETLWIADTGVTLRLFACDCADAALHAERKAGREPHPATWEAVRVGRLWATGNATEGERSAAEDAVWSAARNAAWSKAREAAESAARSASRSSAESAAWSAALSAAKNTAWSAAWSAHNRMLTKALMALGPKRGDR